MHNLASTYKNQGGWGETEELGVQVIETSKTKLGGDHPSTLISMDNLQSPSTDIRSSEVLHQNSVTTLSKLSTIRGFYSKILLMQSFIGSFPSILPILIIIELRCHKVI
jgi:hypothetical protein